MEEEGPRAGSRTPSPIIHIPEANTINSYEDNADIAMVTDSSKVKVNKDAEKQESVIINASNFNLCRPSRSKEVVNGLQCLYLEMKQKKRQQKEAAKLLLDFMKKKRQKMNEIIKLENLQRPNDDKALVTHMEKEPERFGPVRNSIELNENFWKYSARNWLPNLNLQLIHPASNGSNQPAIHLPASGVCKGYTVTSMTTTLPRITPCSTPLPPALAPARSHSSASMYSSYGAYPPPELSSSLDYANIPKRINPLAPPPPRKRINWSWETTDQHYENEKRRLLMQKREHTRYHSAWSKAFYGSPAEAEAYRRHFREVLKQQMSDKDVSKKVHMQQKIKETERAIAYDRECRMNDANEYFRKHNYLMKFRDGNKNLMENTWDAKKFNKQVEDRIDRERLRYNPINWSCSLK